MSVRFSVLVTKQAAGLGQGSVFGGPVEQALADRLLETADGLTDRRLRAVQFHRGARKTAFGGDFEKDA